MPRACGVDTRSCGAGDRLRARAPPGRPSDEVVEIFSSFGRAGVPAEKVGDEVARQAREYLVSRGAVAEYLADQLLLPMALAGAGSFTATKLSMHARTNLDDLKVSARSIRSAA